MSTILGKLQTSEHAELKQFITEIQKTDNNHIAQQALLYISLQKQIMLLQNEFTSF